MARLGIAAPQRSAAEAGAAAFAAGGNAIDAALAAAVSLTVTYPNNCALGGDLIALVRRADGATAVINASGPAPARTEVAAVRARAGRTPIDGPDAVTVPGLIAGLWALWSFGATRSWSAAFEAGIAQAREGVEVAPTLAAALALDAERLAADPGARAVFLAGDAPLAAGDTLRQPALAASLAALAEEGPDAFYRGRLGASLVARLRSLGSPMRADDLAGFAPEHVAPLNVALAGQEIATAPPNSQGFLLPLILRAAGRVDPLGAGAGALAAAFRRALAARARLCDPAFQPVPVDELMAADAPAPARAGTGDTVAVVAADDAGNTVSLIQSVFGAFGAGILDPETGILCHNRGACFSLDPGSPNVLAPGKRPAHTLMPCTVFEHGRPVVVTGTMGGAYQPQILSQVLLRLRLGASAQEAVDAPRWVLDAGGGELLLEPGVPAAARQALAGFGAPLLGLDGEAGHAQLVTLGAQGPDAAASDPRSEGAGIIATHVSRPRAP